MSHRGLNLHPLDGMGSGNVWSMSRNTRLGVGNRDFPQSLDLWHSCVSAHIGSATGNLVVESSFETRSTNVLGGKTFIDGILPSRPAIPPPLYGQVTWSPVRQSLFFGGRSYRDSDSWSMLPDGSFYSIKGLPA